MLDLTKGVRRTRIQKESATKITVSLRTKFYTLSGTPPQCVRLGGYFFALTRFRCEEVGLPYWITEQHKHAAVSRVCPRRCGLDAAVAKNCKAILAHFMY